MEYFTPKILQALEFASVAHSGQKRKFPGDIPYISHPAAVALILSRSGYQDTVIIAGVLHDIIEDTSFTAHDLETRFGKDVLELVMAVTENKSLPWHERKAKYLENLKSDPEEAKAISAADLLSNRMSNLLPLKGGLNPWNQFSRDPKEYARKIFEIDKKRLEVIKENTNIAFVPELEKVMQEVEDLTWKMLL